MTGGSILPYPSTGNEPSNLKEQLVMEEAMSNPTSGKVIVKSLNDSRFPGWLGWQKYSYSKYGINVHYVGNRFFPSWYPFSMWFDYKIRFTRDLNISNIVNCFGVVSIKKNIYYVVIADFYTWKTILLLKNTKNIELIDSNFDGEVSFVTNKTYSYTDEIDNETIKVHCDWVVANKWVIEHESFLALINYSQSLALKIYYEKTTDNCDI